MLKLVLYLLCSFVKAKSDVSSEDVTALVEFGLELFHVSQNKLYAQVILRIAASIYSHIFLVTCLLSLFLVS